MTKRYRFFYHYYRAKRAMTIHFRGACYVVKDVECQVPCETKWSEKQPYLRMQGFAHGLTIYRGVGRIW